MKKTITFLIALSVLLTMLSGCTSSDGNIEDFTSIIAGIWQRNGNLHDMRLEIQEDGNWTNQELRDGTWEITDQGIISYDEEYKMFNFETENKFYPVEYSSDGGEVLHYKNDNYYRLDTSVDGFAAYNGTWYLNGDRNSDYYAFDNGEWKWYEPQNMAHVSVNSGNLAWDETVGELLAYSSADGEVFAAFRPSDTGELISNGVPYVFMDDLSSDEISDSNDATSMEDSHEAEKGQSLIVLNEFYFLNGEQGRPSFYFYSDGQVDYDESYDSQTVEAVYTIDDDQITIKLPTGELMGTLAIMDAKVLVDVSDGDIGDFYKLAQGD
ncbi:MAG: hypothetical protein ACOX2Q_11000 [Dehalobacterium sp.]|jgi:hypothetical protein